MRIIFSLAFAVSLFFSPDFLTIFGNGVGILGFSYLCILVLVFTLHTFTAKSYADIYSLGSPLNNEYLFISRSLGNVAGFLFPFFNKAVMAVCLGVGILATAGYAFNEIFARWFPNMAFTLASLGFLLIIGLTGYRVIRIFQIIFSGVTFLGVFFLSVVALFSFGGSIPFEESIHSLEIENVSFIISCFVLLMGFEMMKNQENGRKTGDFNLVKTAYIALTPGFLLMFIWGIVSLMYVSPERISYTSIPHLITARAVNSSYGREIMGLVIVFGSIGAVNALLTYVSFTAGEVFSNELPFGIKKKQYGTIALILMVSITAGLLIWGMAGEPEFETFIRGGIYLWLLNYGTIHLSMFAFRKKTEMGNVKSLPIRPYCNLTSAIIIFGLYCGMVLTDPETVLILEFTGIVIVGALILYLFIMGLRKYHFNNGRTKGGIK